MIDEATEFPRPRELAFSTPRIWIDPLTRSFIGDQQIVDRASSTETLGSLVSRMSASLIGRFGSSAFRLSTASVLMSLTGPCFYWESASRPFHHRIVHVWRRARNQTASENG